MSDPAQASTDDKVTSEQATRTSIPDQQSDQPTITDTKPTFTSNKSEETRPSLTVFDDEGELSFNGNVKRGYYRAFQEYIANEYPGEDLSQIREKLRDKITSKAASTQKGDGHADDVSRSRWKGLTVRFIRELREEIGYGARKDKFYTAFCKDLEEVDSQSSVVFPPEPASTGTGHDLTFQPMTRKEFFEATILTKSVEEGVKDVDKLSALSQKHTKSLNTQFLKNSGF